MPTQRLLLATAFGTAALIVVAAAWWATVPQVESFVAQLGGFYVVFWLAVATAMVGLAANPRRWAGLALAILAGLTALVGAFGVLVGLGFSDGSVPWPNMGAAIASGVLTVLTLIRVIRGSGSIVGSADQRLGVLLFGTGAMVFAGAGAGLARGARAMEDLIDRRPVNGGEYQMMTVAVLLAWALVGVVVSDRRPSPRAFPAVLSGALIIMVTLTIFGGFRARDDMARGLEVTAQRVAACEGRPVPTPAAAQPPKSRSVLPLTPEQAAAQRRTMTCTREARGSAPFSAVFWLLYVGGALSAGAAGYLFGTRLDAVPT